MKRRQLEYMNRLTTREQYPHGSEGKSLDSLTGNYCRGVFEATAVVEKLADYEKMEEDGKLLILPCKPGDTVWLLHQTIQDKFDHNYTVSKMTVVEQRANKLNPVWFIIEGPYGRTSFSPSSIGKTVFLTEEEAKEAMEVKRCQQGKN